VRREPDDAVHAHVPRNPLDELLEGPADARGAARPRAGTKSPRKCIAKRSTPSGTITTSALRP
jgi:hypothetical protein